MELKDLNPQLVWKNFYLLTQIPRPSKKEGQAVDYATFERASAERCARIVERMVAEL